jgi:hypothetical protein
MKHPISAYFSTRADIDTDAISERLWNRDVTPESYAATDEKYRAAIMDQYKLYVEMADRISARRALANTFFLSINTAVFTLIGVIWGQKPDAPDWVLIFPLIALVAECMMWYWILRSYRQLNTGKFAVVGAIEKCLPASPYWNAEWVAFGEGKDPRRYWPLSHVESLVPLLFALTYIGAYVAALVT